LESLAVKYRPKTFDDVVSQDSIKRILERQLELNEFKNAYMFCGPSGCGKTTIARIFATRINNGIGVPIEIDAASNNGVENVKNIVSEANERSIDSKYKIYIIDECHSLTNQAWQAFLKCIEEPPAYTIFMFATTDPQKVPATILNRCMRFNIQKIPSQEIKKRLDFICKSEGYSNYSETIDAISKMCKNQCRDAIAMLEKVAAYSENFNTELSLKILGGISTKIYFSLMNSLIDGNQAKVLEIIDYLYSNGTELKLFVDLFFDFVLDVTKYILFNNISVTNIPDVYENDVKYSIKFDNNLSYYNYVLDKTLELKNMVKTDPNLKNTVEVAFLQICRLK